MHFKLLVNVFVASTLLTSAAYGVDQRQLVAEDQKRLPEYVQRVNATCGGTKLAFSIDYASYRPWWMISDSKVHVKPPSSFLMDAGDAIMNICSTDAGKRAVSEKIQQVRIIFKSDGEEETLSDGTFSYKVGSHSYPAGPETWLRTHL